MKTSIIGERLRFLRKQAGLSQKALTEKIGDLKQAVYARYELGAICPSYPVLIKLADYYDVSTDFLLGRTDNPHGKYFGKDALSQNDQAEDFIAMCFEPDTLANQKLKATLKQLLEENQ